MKFSFVILTWNRHKFLERCLQALLPSIADRSDAEIIIMDNGSTDATKDVLARYRDEENVRIITRDKNYGLTAYKKLFWAARGKYVVVVDDDVLEFPAGVDRIFEEYMEAFPDFGFLCLNVVQNEHTNGAMPLPEHFTEVTRNGRTVDKGPAGGWCACFRRWQYRMLWPVMASATLDMKASEDGFLVHNFRRWLRLSSGVIRDKVCFHACGPYYAQQFGHLDREIEKYAASGLTAFVDVYKSFRKPADPDPDGGK